MNRGLYYLGCFVAIVVLESLPRFLFEVEHPFMIVERAILLTLFLLVAWFFDYSLHSQWRWSLLSSMFVVDAIAAITLAALLFMQLFSPWFVLVSAIVILVRAGVFSYLVAHRLPQLRSLVFFSSVLLLTVGELVIAFGVHPF